MWVGQLVGIALAYIGVFIPTSPAITDIDMWHVMTAGLHLLGRALGRDWSWFRALVVQRMYHTNQ